MRDEDFTTQRPERRFETNIRSLLHALFPSRRFGGETEISVANCAPRIAICLGRREAEGLNLEAGPAVRQTALLP